MAAVAAQKAAQIAASFGVKVAPPPAFAGAMVPAPGSLSAAPAGPGSSMAVLAANANRPAPLRLDAQGREVDEFGNAVYRNVQVWGAERGGREGRAGQGRAGQGGPASPARHGCGRGRGWRVAHHGWYGRLR